MIEHHVECEKFRQRSDFYPCICPQLEFVAGRAVVLAMDDLHDKVRLLDLSGTAAERRGFHLAVGAVLGLIDGGGDADQ
jgi:hypothetical protein